MLRALGLGLMALVWISAAPAAAETRLFTDPAALQIAITAPFPALVRNAPKSVKPYPATLTLTTGAGPQTFPIQLSARGKTRRTIGFCRFPPLSVRFDKASVQNSLFQGQGRLKLVTYCRQGEDYEQRVVLEYLTYRLYNVLTPFSYRVRAADVTYRDSDADKGLTRFGFLIEDTDDVAERNRRGKLTAGSHQVTAARLDARAAGRAALFEYMIGNLDFDFLAVAPGLDCCHNSHFIAAKGAAVATATAVVPVPYDFDHSGLVDAPYALPPEALKVKRVTDRLYRGYCVTNGEFPAVSAEFVARRAELMAVIETEPRLTPAVRAKTLRFLEDFFTVLADPERVQRDILGRCRQSPAARG